MERRDKKESYFQEIRTYEQPSFIGGWRRCVTNFYT